VANQHPFARATLLTGWLCWWLGFVAAAAVFVTLGFRWFLILVVPCVLVMLIGLRMIQGTRPLLARPAERVRAVDRRAPVLYLRSFHDDELMQRYTNQISEDPQNRTSEEALANAFRLVGPVIGLSEPGAAPRLGAARTHSENSQWQTDVVDLMQEAALVVLRVGDTEGFWWELEQALKLVPPERLVFVIPAQADRWRQLVEVVQRQIPGAILPAELTQSDVGHPRIISAARGLLYFDSDWTAHVSLFAFRWRSLLRASRRQNPVLVGAFRPVLRRAGVEPRAPVTFLAVIVLIGFAGLGALIIRGPKEFKIEASVGFAFGLAAVLTRTIGKKLIAVARRRRQPGPRPPVSQERDPR
jgi:hypothetical protein